MLERVLKTLVPSPDREVIARQLLALEVAERVLSTADRNPRQPIQVIQISADTPIVFSPARRTAEEKLTGIQLNHFGAFYKRSWRANDWLWGRLDGSARLSQIILAPRRLRQLSYDSTTVRNALEVLVMSGGEDKNVVLSEHWDELSIRDELRYLDDRSAPRSGQPSRLRTCCQRAAPA